jgi:hypothetical protein
LCHFNFTFTIPVLEKPYQKYEVLGYPLYGLNLLHKKTNKKSIILSINNIIEGLIALDNLMKANGIDYVLTGSLGLYLHGITPISYVPHDIDIIFSDNNDKLPNMTSQMILDLFVYYCGGERADYTCYNVSDLFVFYIGNDMIVINAFVDRKDVFSNSDYCTMNIMGHNIKVNKALSIFEEKYKLRRLKDYEFNNKIETSLNSFFKPEQAKDFEEIYNEMLSTDKIRDFFNGINWVLGQTEINIFEIMFNEDVAKIWLPQRVWEKCIIKATSWDNSSKKNSILFGIEGEFTNISKLDEWRVFQGCLKHDMSYMVDFLYHILSTMKIVDYFAKHVNELINAVNKYEKPIIYDTDDLPF